LSAGCGAGDSAVNIPIRIRILDAAELDPYTWYFDMHRGNFKPDYPMAGLMEYKDEEGVWRTIQQIDPPTTKDELNIIIKGSP
jgi:hypothetical protein